MKTNQEKYTNSNINYKERIKSILDKEIIKWGKEYYSNVEISSRKNAITKLRINKFRKEIILIIPKSLEKISEEILIGLIDSLIIRFDKTFNADIEKIEMYNEFVKQLSETYIVSEEDETLKKIFDKVNKTYLNSIIDKCNLKWSNKENIRTMGTYNLNNNTITISKILKNESDELIEFVMYHEMLHKLFKFKGTLKKRYHFKEFRELENQFPNKERIEKEIRKIITRKKPKLFGRWK